MVPHRVFYVWLGKSQRPQYVDMCLRNWRRVLPESFEIIEIGESPGPWFDLQAEMKRNRWLREVYRRRMWAFVADYVRCRVLYEHGGVYLDTDVTLEKDISPLLERDELFLGYESPEVVNFSVGGAAAGNPALKALLEFYEEEIWRSPKATLPDILTSVLRSRFQLPIKCPGHVVSLPGVDVYPSEYFYPFRYGSVFTPTCVTPQTYCIHWWGESWVSPEIQYFLQHKHEPGFDPEKTGQACNSVRIRLFGVPLLTIKTCNGIRHCMLFGFLPVMRLSGRRGALLGLIPLRVREKKTRV